MYTFSPMMVANSRKHHCRVRPYTQEVLVISTNLDTQKNHNPLDFTNRRGDEARIKNTWANNVPEFQNMEHVQNFDNQPLRRSERSSVFPNKYNEYVVDSNVKYGLERYVGYSNLTSENFCFVTELNKSFEPKNYWEACKDQHWVEAMNKEMDALYRNDTWDITDLPKGRKFIGGKWVFKIKYKSNGEIERYKARYVVKGYNQKEGIDFDETFSPVVKIVTVRCVINLVVQNNWVLYQLDINNAFLYGELHETVYMDLPEEIQKFKEFLRTKFEIKDLGKLKYFLGIEVLETDQGLCLSQRKYCLDLLSEFRLLACKPSATPLKQNLTITNEPTEVDKGPKIIKKPFLPYRSKTGTLIFPTGKFIGVYYSEELKYAVGLGYKVVPISGYLFERKESPFKDFVSSLFLSEARKEGNDVLSYVYKILMNSLYGRFEINPKSTIA
ncbi:ribonuclease H-like domain-containing protein [Tanacetum coccineum]